MGPRARTAGAPDTTGRSQFDDFTILVEAGCTVPDVEESCSGTPRKQP